MGKDNTKDEKKSSGNDKKKGLSKAAKRFWFGIMGVGIGTAVASIAFSSFIVYFNTGTNWPKYAVIPQLVFATGILGTVFYKAFSNIK